MHASTRSRIYLSPHLDDAVLSCGGTIYAQTRRGERVLVVTVFAGSPPNVDLTPFTRELRERWGGASDPFAARRAEDRAATASLGAEALHLSYLDCVYRQHPDTREVLYPTVEHIFAEVHAAESGLADALYDVLRGRLAAHAQPLVYAPLAAGRHVDHQIVRRAAMRLMADGVEVAFYEDWPYAGDAETMARALGGERERWRRSVSPLSEAALAAKGDAVACYASQISTFWSGIEAMRLALREQAERVGDAGLGEALWSLTCPASHPTPVKLP
jgi:LmbE family N-acetylglucosaminyl deacetylase